jgi:hypothetical protein
MTTTLNSLGPVSAARKMANTSDGSASHASTMRITTWSTQPPR